MAKKYSDDYEIYILTGDKDLYALVNEKVKIYDTLKKKIF
jgi:5'-3' exonuclease